MKHSVQKADEQLLVKLRTEESLKAKVSMWINVFLYHNAAIYYFISKYTAFLLIYKHLLAKILHHQNHLFIILLRNSLVIGKPEASPTTASIWQ